MRKLLFSICFILSCLLLNAQHLPQIGNLKNDTVIVNSGNDYLLIPQITNGESGIEQVVNLQVTSSDPGILEIKSVDFNQANHFAIVNVAEKGKIGEVTITIEAKDADGILTRDFKVIVGNYNKPGIKFSVYDIVFWQEMVPLKNNSVYDSITMQSRMQLKDYNFTKIPITVNQDCKESPPCTGHDFFTAFFKGFLIPLTSGNYTFYMEGSNAKGLWLSDNTDFDKAQPIVYTGSKITKAGTDVGNNQTASTPVALEAGKIYAIYAVHWTIHSPETGILWEGPGIPKDYINGKYVMPMYDPIMPTVPQNLTLLTKGTNLLRFSWNAATDNSKLKGYIVYLDGAEMNRTNETFVQIDGLKSATTYSVAVASFDEMGNVSVLSNSMNVTTFPEDSKPPSPPTNINTEIVSDLALKISWKGATDAETGVIGYHVFVDGNLHNTNGILFNDTLIIKPLLSQTSYKVEIEAVDAALNVSTKSNIFTVTTLAFDPNAPGLGVCKAKMKFSLQNIGTSEGFGVNPDYVNGEIFNQDIIKLLKDLQPGCIRWGALTANPLSFSDYSGTGKKMTMAKFMDLANQLGAYSAITTGVQDATDWRKDSKTFANFIEYLAGPADSPYGSKRAAEGFSEPLINKSKGLIIELGNEVWGGAGLHNAEIGANYTNYGKWCREVGKVMKSSPYFDSKKMFIAYSGRNPHPTDSYGLHGQMLRGDSGQVDWLAVSGYLGGNLNYDPEIPVGESELDYYKNGIERMAYNLTGLNLQMIEDLKLTGFLKPTYFYESNMTTPAYNGRLGQAIIMTDYMATAVEKGSAIPTIFHLTGGEWKITAPGLAYKRLPLFVTTKLINVHCKGSILKTDLESQGVISNQDGTKIDIAPVSCHTYTNNGFYSILLISRDFENDYVVQVDLPNDLKFNSDAKKYVVTGNSYSTTDAKTDSIDINLKDLDLVNVPKYGMVLITFTGDKQSFEKLPIGTFSYSKIQSIKIKSQSGSFDINTNSGELNLTAEITPAEAFFNILKWEKETTIGVTGRTATDGYKIIGSGRCDGNGEVKVRAIAIEDAKVFDQINIKITGQQPSDGCENNINDDKEDKLVTCYPNPLNNTLYIVNNSNSVVSIKIIDILGKTLISKNFHDTTNEIDTSGFIEGIYLLRIETRNKTIIKKILKKGN